MTEVSEAAVAAHYGVEDLGAKILAAVRRAGLDAEALTPADLAPVDEIHMGGRPATAYLAKIMDLPAGTGVLEAARLTVGPVIARRQA